MVALWPPQSPVKKSKKRKSEVGAVDVAMEDVEAPAEAEGTKKSSKDKEEFYVPIDAIAPIAAPLAGKKLSKKLFKTVKKGRSIRAFRTFLLLCPFVLADPIHPLPPPRSFTLHPPLCPLASKARQLKRGVKEVVKALRKGEKGLLLLASNITPIDILSHLPVLAEDSQVKYCWVLAKCVPSLKHPQPSPLVHARPSLNERMLTLRLVSSAPIIQGRARPGFRYKARHIVRPYLRGSSQAQGCPGRWRQGGRQGLEGGMGRHHEGGQRACELPNFNTCSFISSQRSRLTVRHGGRPCRRARLSSREGDIFSDLYAMYNTAHDKQMSRPGVSVSAFHAFPLSSTFGATLAIACMTWHS